jgi:hypothetical protein
MLLLVFSASRKGSKYHTSEKGDFSGLYRGLAADAFHISIGYNKGAEKISLNV